MAAPTRQLTTADAPPRRRTGGSNVRFTVEVAVVFGLLLPLLLATRARESLSQQTDLAALALAVFAAARLAVTAAAGRSEYLTLSFYVFVYCWFGLSGFLSLSADFFAFPENYLGRTFSHYTRQRALVVIWLGVLAYEFGLLLTKRTRTRASTARRAISMRRVRALAMLSIALTGFFFASRGLAALTSSRDQFRQSVGSGGYGQLMTLMLFRLAPFASAYLLILLYRQPGGKPWRTASAADKALAVATMVVAIVANNPMITPRSIVGAMFLAFVYAYIRPWNRRAQRLTAVAAISVVLLAYPFAGRFRRAEPTETGPSSLTQVLTSTHDFAMYGQVHTAIEYVDLEGVSWGRQLSGVVFFWVPRTVWQGKPFDTGDTMHDALGYPERLNLSSPLWAEAYVDGGIPWLIVVFVGYGAGSGYLQRRFRSAGPGTAAALLMPVVAGYQLYFLRGSLAAFVPPFLSLVVLLLAATQRQHPRPTDAAAVGRVARPPARGRPGGP